MTQTPYNKEELTYRTRSVDPYIFYGERCVCNYLGNLDFKALGSCTYNGWSLPDMWSGHVYWRTSSNRNDSWHSRAIQLINGKSSESQANVPASFILLCNHVENSNTTVHCLSSVVFTFSPLPLLIAKIQSHKWHLDPIGNLSIY